MARGDLGVEMPPEKVPVIQKHVIRRAADWRKPVIIATQMLESMIENPRPTRAEASDVANAVFDGTDAVMLSAETASGLYPREAVTMMAKIAVEAEANMTEFLQRRRRDSRKFSIAETICESIAHAAQDLHIAAIAVFTESGATARLISKFRPKTAIFAFGNTPEVCNRMNLYWGVHPILRSQTHTTEEMVATAEQELCRRRPSQRGRRGWRSGRHAAIDGVDQLYAAASGQWLGTPVSLLLAEQFMPFRGDVTSSAKEQKPRSTKDTKESKTISASTLSDDEQALTVVLRGTREELEIEQFSAGERAPRLGWYLFTATDRACRRHSQGRRNTPGE